MTTALGLSPTADAPRILTLDAAEASDCIAQVLMLQELRPDHRILIGSLLAYCRDDMQDAQPWYWQRPWVQHAWLVDSSGNVVDPAAWNLEAWAEQSACTLPSDISELTAEIIPAGPDQQKAIEALMFGPFNQPPANALRYCPGVVFGSPYDLNKPSQRWLGVWGSLARATDHAGGFTAKQLREALEMVPRMMQAPESKPRKSKGFG